MWRFKKTSAVETDTLTFMTPHLWFSRHMKVQRSDHGIRLLYKFDASATVTYWRLLLLYYYTVLYTVIYVSYYTVHT